MQLYSLPSSRLQESTYDPLLSLTNSLSEANDKLVEYKLHSGSSNGGLIRPYIDMDS